jgi:NAD(P)-dependent dehydrogenase (short-subunit alcohol dehydrogenase family)
MTKVGAVTGAGSGIGRASSVALARLGFAMVVVGRTEASLAATAEACRAVGPEPLVVVTDVGDAAAVVRLFDAIRSRFGRLDLLFNNAGIGAPAVPMEDLPLETWQRVLATNLTGTFLMTREAMRLMKSQQPRGGRIINNGSISAHVPRPLSAPYTATKHAITGLTRSTALDGRAFDIACGQIDIGNAATDMTAHMVATQQADGRIASEPTIPVEHVADAIAYMAGLPLDANVQFLTVMATKMPFIGRG